MSNIQKDYTISYKNKLQIYFIIPSVRRRGRQNDIIHLLFTTHCYVFNSYIYIMQLFSLIV